MKLFWKRKTAYALALILGVTSIWSGMTFSLPALSKNVSVVQAASISISPGTLEIAVDDSMELTASVDGIESSTSVTFEWSSKDENIATITSSGNGNTATLKGIQAGVTTITTKAFVNGEQIAGLSAFYRVTDGTEPNVTVSIDDITLDHSQLKKNEEITLIVDVSVDPDTKPDVEIYTDDTDIINITDLSDLTMYGNSGSYRVTKTIKGIAAGKAIIEVYATSVDGGAAKDGITIEVLDTSDSTVKTEDELNVALQSGGTITLGNNISCKNEIHVSNTPTVLDLNGYTLTTHGTSYINGDTTDGAYGMFAEKPLSIQGNGKIIGGIEIEDGAALKLYNGSCSFISIRDGAAFDMYGGTIYGYGVMVDNGGYFDLFDGNIKGSKTSGCIIQGKCIMYGGSISESNTMGVEVTNGGEFILRSGNINANNIWGVVVDSNSGFTMLGGAISSNKQEAGVWLSGGSFTMSDGTISSNKGLGVFVGKNSTFTMKGGNITENQRAGVEVVNTSTFNLSGAPQITGNNSENSFTGNVFLPEVSSKITINGTLQTGCKVGVFADNRYNNIDFTKNYRQYNSSTDPNQFFASDNSRYGVSLNSETGEVKFSTVAEIISKAAVAGDPSIITNQYSTSAQKAVLQETIQNSTEVQAQIKTLENTYTSNNDITVNPPTSTDERIDAEKIEVIGAGLAASANESIGLTISDSNTNLAIFNTNSYEDIYSFEMNLVKGDGTKVTTLDIPVTITLPIPSGMSYSSLRILHFIDGGEIEVLTPAIVNGKARFTITHFSTFAFADVKTTTSSGNTTTTSSASSGGSSSSNLSSGGSSSGSSGSSGSSSSSKIRSTGASKAYYSKIGKTSVQYDSPALSYKAKAVKVPAAIKINKKTYKVTAIAANAFTGYDKLTSVTIGKNVKRIGKNAFSGCKKLKTITISSKKLTAKKIKGALSGSSIKTVYVPAEKVKVYKKIFTQKNVGRKVTVKAIK